jgi:hypothetical protein
VLKIAKVPCGAHSDAYAARHVTPSGRVRKLSRPHRGRTRR